MECAVFCIHYFWMIPSWYRVSTRLKRWTNACVVIRMNLRFIICSFMFFSDPHKIQSFFAMIEKWRAWENSRRQFESENNHSVPNLRNFPERESEIATKNLWKKSSKSEKHLNKWCTITPNHSPGLRWKKIANSNVRILIQFFFSLNPKCTLNICNLSLQWSISLSLSERHHTETEYAIKWITIYNNNNN